MFAEFSGFPLLLVVRVASLVVVYLTISLLSRECSQLTNDILNII